MDAVTVPPFIAPSIMDCNSASSDELKAFQCRGKRLAMKFEGGWSTASCRLQARRYGRACNRREAPEGYDFLFYDQDKGTKQITRMLNFQSYDQEMGDYY